MMRAFSQTLESTTKNQVWRQAILLTTLSELLQKFLEKSNLHTIPNVRLLHQEIDKNLKITLICTEPTCISWLKTEAGAIEQFFYQNLLTQQLVTSETQLNFRFKLN